MGTPGEKPDLAKTRDAKLSRLIPTLARHHPWTSSLITMFVIAIPFIARMGGSKTPAYVMLGFIALVCFVFLPIDFFRQCINDKANNDDSKEPAEDKSLSLRFPRTSILLTASCIVSFYIANTGFEIANTFKLFLVFIFFSLLLGLLCDTWNSSNAPAIAKGILASDKTVGIYDTSQLTKRASLRTSMRRLRKITAGSLFTYGIGLMIFWSASPEGVRNWSEQWFWLSELYRPLIPVFDVMAEERGLYLHDGPRAPATHFLFVGWSTFIATILAAIVITTNSPREEIEAPSQVAGLKEKILLIIMMTLLWSAFITIFYFAYSARTAPFTLISGRLSHRIDVDTILELFLVTCAFSLFVYAIPWTFLIVRKVFQRAPPV